MSVRDVRTDRRRRALVVGVVLALYVLLGNDGRHHWHEWRYLYSATHYTVPELAAGDFDPGPPPERSREEVGAWYWGQLGHEALLRAVVGQIGEGPRSATLIGWLYGLMIPLAALLACVAIRRLPLSVDPLLLWSAALLAPLGPYLGFKLLAEVPALLFGAAGLMAFVASLTARTRTGLGLSLALGGLGLAASFLTMVYVPVMVLSFGSAVAWVFGADVGRRRAWGRLLAMVGVAAAVAGTTLAALGLGPDDYWAMYRFYREYVKPVSASLFGLAMAGSALYLLVPVSLLSPRRRDLRFFLTWAGLAVVPVLALSTNYIEPRFLSVAMLPFAGLCALALERLAAGPGRGRRVPELLTYGLTLTVPPAVTAFSLPLMPYEMNSRDLVATVRKIWKGSPDAVILLPWNYTDYHFATFVYPTKPVYLVQSPVDHDGHVLKDAAWERRIRTLYGKAYIGNLRELEALGDRPAYYVGHGALPPIQRLQALSHTLRLSYVTRQLDAMKPMFHLGQSWMWNNPQVLLKEVPGVGQYQAFEVHRLPEPQRRL